MGFFLHPKVEQEEVTKRWNKEQMEQTKKRGEGPPKAKSAATVPSVPFFRGYVPPKKSTKSRANNHNGTTGTKGTKKL